MPDTRISPLRRFKFARIVLWRPWVAVVSAVYAICGALQFIDDTLATKLPDDLKRQWDSTYELPALSWQTWVVIGLSILVVALFEGAYRYYRRVHTEWSEKHGGVLAELERYTTHKPVHVEVGPWFLVPNVQDDRLESVLLAVAGVIATNPDERPTAITWHATIPFHFGKVMVRNIDQPSHDVLARLGDDVLARIGTRAMPSIVNFAGRSSAPEGFLVFHVGPEMLAAAASVNGHDMYLTVQDRMGHPEKSFQLYGALSALRKMTHAHKPPSRPTMLGNF